MARSLVVQTSPVTLNWAASARRVLGDPHGAIACYEQALAIVREVGDRGVEAVTRYNIAMIYRADGRFTDAVAELEQVVELDRLVQPLSGPDGLTPSEPAAVRTKVPKRRPR